MTTLQKIKIAYAILNDPNFQKMLKDVYAVIQKLADVDESENLEVSEMEAIVLQNQKLADEIQHLKRKNQVLNEQLQ